MRGLSIDQSEGGNCILLMAVCLHTFTSTSMDTIYSLFDYLCSFRIFTGLQPNQAFSLSSAALSRALAFLRFSLSIPPNVTKMPKSYTIFKQPANTNETHNFPPEDNTPVNNGAKLDAVVLTTLIVPIIAVLCSAGNASAKNAALGATSMF